MEPKLKLEGKSGCKLETYTLNGGAYVRKFSSDHSYNERLYNQYIKQKAFYEANQNTLIFTTPKPGEFTHSITSIASFSMQYIRGYSYSEFLIRASVNELKNLIYNYISFIKFEINKSVLSSPDRSLIYKKTAQIKYSLIDKNIYHPTFFETLDYLEKNIPEEMLHIGICHGDLTLSNQIFANNKIYLIDFLDSFIEAPIIDLVKLRQDSKYCWSLFIDENLKEYQLTKILQVHKFLDISLLAFINENSYLQKWYDFLEKLNLLRIVPYAKNARELVFLENALKDILYNCTLEHSAFKFKK